MANRYEILDESTGCVVANLWSRGCSYTTCYLALIYRSS